MLIATDVYSLGNVCILMNTKRVGLKRQCPYIGGGLRPATANEEELLAVNARNTFTAESINGYRFHLNGRHVNDLN